MIESPHEPEVRFAIKRGQHWIGYKVQISETYDDDRPHLLVDIEPTSALANDAPELPHIQHRLQGRQLQPQVQQVDQAYMSGELLVKSQAAGIELLGIPPADTQGPPGFRQGDFQIDVPTQQAVCPQGQPRQRWREFQRAGGGPPEIQVHFRAATCRNCPAFGRCTRSRHGRSLTLHPYRVALLARRAQAQSAAFQAQLHARAGIEATISELVRQHGLRWARYRSLTKLRYQHYFTAIAVNLKRLTRWWQQTAPAAAVSG